MHLPFYQLLGVALLFPNLAAAEAPQPSLKPLPSPALKLPSIVGPAVVQAAIGERMFYSGLAPSKIVPDLCVYKYRITTTSPECQRFVDQGLGYYYSYVWMEAARSFETALQYDPNCAFAYWGLSRALEKWSKPHHLAPLQVAQTLLTKAGQREQLLITSRLQEKGMAAGVKPDERQKKARATVDELLTLYEDDEEGWFCRAQLSPGTEAVPYYKALLRLDPLHPGANHELIHFYEGYKRPALGWPNAEGYIASSPAIPHAFHMQAHLAMRIGKWEKTTDRSARAIELERAYHRALNVNPKDDFQFVHHLETLTLSLVHDGRFAEARDIQKEARGLGYKFNLPWFRLHLAEHDWDEANKIVAEFRKSDKPMAAYLAALLYLDQGETARAAAEVDVLRQAQQAKKNDRRLEQRLWETQGRLLCQQGSGEAGLKLLQRAVNQTKDDYLHHAWAGGAYYMEAWGIGALECGNAPAAEEGFMEALAHDAGSVRAALGLQALCERLGRTDEAHRYANLAHRLWTKADPKHFEQLRDDLIRRATHIESPASSASSR
jgi:Tfp pilus assembly protein PilF